MRSGIVAEAPRSNTDVGPGPPSAVVPGDTQRPGRQTLRFDGYQIAYKYGPPMRWAACRRFRARRTRTCSFDQSRNAGSSLARFPTASLPALSCYARFAVSRRSSPFGPTDLETRCKRSPGDAGQMNRTLVDRAKEFCNVQTPQATAEVNRGAVFRAPRRGCRNP
jgi:hypothetical protein